MKDYERNMLSVVEKVHQFLLKTFSGFHVEGPELPKEVLGGAASTMLVSTHRSHIDYFILGELFHRMGVKDIRFAAGDNLTQLPIIGKKFVGFGAFPIARDRAAGKNYVRSLCDTIVNMVEAGESIIVFPESGRSYKGDMMEMRGVVLSAHILAQHHHPEKSFYMIPIAISYDQLPELLYFKMLEKGKSLRKAKGSWFKKTWGSILYFGADLIAFGKFTFAYRFRKKYGNVYIDYDRPFAVKDVVDLAANFKQGSRDELTGHRASIQQITDVLYRKLFALYRILPMHVVASILKEHGPMDAKQTQSFVKPLVEMLVRQGRNLKSLPTDDPARLVEVGVAQLVKMKGVKLSRGRVEIRDAAIVDYYAATISSESREAAA
jgi:glycerol-3-phosphate O-acyltransferase